MNNQTKSVPNTTQSPSQNQSVSWLKKFSSFWSSSTIKLPPEQQINFLHNSKVEHFKNLNDILPSRLSDTGRAEYKKLTLSVGGARKSLHKSKRQKLKKRKTRRHI